LFVKADTPTNLSDVSDCVDEEMCFLMYLGETQLSIRKHIR